MEDEAVTKEEKKAWLQRKIKKAREKSEEAEMRYFRLLEKQFALEARLRALDPAPRSGSSLTSGQRVALMKQYSEAWNKAVKK